MEETMDAVNSFNVHFNDCESSDELSSPSIEIEKYEEHDCTWPSMRSFKVKIPKFTGNILPANEAAISNTCQSLSTLDQFQLQSQIKTGIRKAGATLCPEGTLTPLQLELLSIIHEYRDLYFTERNFDNGEEIRLVYCMHVMDHVLKTRAIITSNNDQIASKFDVPDNMRDQGMVRPKVLILAPFKDSCYK